MRISQKAKRCFNLKSLTHHFYVETKISGDFQNCVRVSKNVKKLNNPDVPFYCDYVKELNNPDVPFYCDYFMFQEISL